MGRSRQDHLDELIVEVSRGQRDLASIRDADLRERVRLALRLHRQAPAAFDPHARLRVRARVMAALRPHAPTVLDNAWTALWYLARPAPYIVRSVALAVLLVAVGAGASVTSAETVPSDLLYPVKIAAEGVRLALAGAPGDRAAVELSIAEHRLAEAEKLVASGRASDALVASAMYSQHIASAAAELAPEAGVSDLASQLESRIDAQRERAQTLVTALAASSSGTSVSETIATAVVPTAAGATGVQWVAESAVGLATQLAQVADDRATAASAAAPSSQIDTTVRVPSTAVIASGPTERTEQRDANGGRGERATPRPTARADKERKASEVARVVRRALEEARAAAARERGHR